MPFFISSSNALAETSLSVELPTLTLAGEFGVTTSPNDYLAASIFIGPDDVYGGEVNWVRRMSVNRTHWLGAGVGHMNDGGTNSIIDFDLGTYGSINYKYFMGGLDNNGFYFNTSFRVMSDGAFPWVGFGYNW